MAEYTYNAVQEVAYGQAVVLDGSIPCNRGYVMHRDGSGILTLRGIVNSTCMRFARYQVTFNANIAIPTGGTVGPISVALAIDGEPVQTSKAIVTPTVADAYFNVTATAIVTVPSGCCPTVSVENTSEGAAGTGVTIEVQNANLTVTRIA